MRVGNRALQAHDEDAQAAQVQGGGMSRAWGGHTRWERRQEVMGASAAGCGKEACRASQGQIPRDRVESPGSTLVLGRRRDSQR